MADDTRQNRPQLTPAGDRNDIPSWAAWSSSPASSAAESPSSPHDSTSRPLPVRQAALISTTPTSAPKREIVNEMPGGTANTAGGEKIEDYSFFGILKSIQLSEFQHFHRLPCVRDSLLTGIGCGFGAGGFAFVLGRAAWTAYNWSILSFLGSSAGMYEYCQGQIRTEKAGMKRAVEVMDAKRMEKDKMMEEAREKRRREKREKEDAEEAARLEEERRKKQWYRFW